MIHRTKGYIQSLLDKFMDGTTTLDEEDVLVEYFMQHGDIPGDWEDYRQLFAELEQMKPQASPRRYWWWGCAAAAFVAGALWVAIPPSQPVQEQPRLFAEKQDTASILRPEPPNQEVPPDTAVLMQQLKQEPPPPRRRSLRKRMPHINDNVRNYALMARAEQEEQEVEQQIAENYEAVVRAQLSAYGFIPVRQEDGSIIYINEQSVYTAYEE